LARADHDHPERPPKQEPGEAGRPGFGWRWARGASASLNPKQDPRFSKPQPKKDPALQQASTQNKTPRFSKPQPKTRPALQQASTQNKTRASAASTQNKTPSSL
jgi:hypothetical protein